MGQACESLEVQVRDQLTDRPNLSLNYGHDGLRRMDTTVKYAEKYNMKL